MEKENYVMRYKCCNCANEFKKEIKKGYRAKGNGGICPFCGIEDFSADPAKTHEVIEFVV